MKFLSSVIVEIQQSTRDMIKNVVDKPPLYDMGQVQGLAICSERIAHLFIRRERVWPLAVTAFPRKRLLLADDGQLYVESRTRCPHSTSKRIIHQPVEVTDLEPRMLRQAYQTLVRLDSTQH